MRWAFAAVVFVHGLVHLMGFAKAFGLAEMTALTQPISRPAGLLWLVAGSLFIATSVLSVTPWRAWWAVGAIAVVLSQIAIGLSWSDAKYGSLMNLILLACVVFAALTSGPTSLRAEYDRERRRVESTPVRASGAPSQTDVAALPTPVRRYLEVTGAATLPRPSHLRARFHGRIRSGPSAPWMSFVAHQQSFLREPMRLFFMEASMRGVPVQVLHVFRDGAASMRVRALGSIPITSSSGAEMTRAETVTVLNDVCLLAPGAMLDPAIRWDAIDATHARATYTLGPNTISAELVFGADGLLENFVSDDRRITEQGGALRPCRWSTPVRDARAFGPLRLASRGRGIWHPAEGAFSYLEIDIDDVAEN